MGAIAKILLPVDFSPRGVGAARYAAALAHHYGAELTVVRVIEPFSWERVQSSQQRRQKDRCGFARDRTKSRERPRWAIV